MTCDKMAQEKYTNAFLIAAGDEKTNFALELTYNYGKDGPEAYNIGAPSL